jgi:hypothetical protein
MNQQIIGELLNFSGILTGLEQVAAAFYPATLSIAFVMLVFGTMRGFQRPGSERFLHNILRSVVLVALIGSSGLLTEIVQGAVNGLLVWPFSATFSYVNQTITLQPSQTADGRPDISALKQALAAKYEGIFEELEQWIQEAGLGGNSATNQKQPGNNTTPNHPSKDQAGQSARTSTSDIGKKVLDAFNPVNGIKGLENGMKQVADGINQVATTAQSTKEQLARFMQLVSDPMGSARDLAAKILAGIYLLCLVLCAMIIAVMDFLQRVLIILLGMYIPIGFAEFSIQSLKSQAELFFKTYVGVLCWPLGWILVNQMTLALIGAAPGGSYLDLGQLILAIVWAVPLILWVLIGHVLAPFYAQKLIIRGGAAIQGFTGAMIGTVSQGTSAFYGSSARWGAGGVRSLGAGLGGAFGSCVDGLGGGNGNGNTSTGPAESGAKSSGGGSGKKRGPSWGDRVNGAIGLLSNVAATPLDAAEAGMNRVGGLGQTIGGLISEASGDRLDVEYGTVAPFGPPATRSSSSQRARNYLRNTK